MKIIKHLSLVLGLTFCISLQTTNAQTLHLKDGSTYEVTSTSKTTTGMEVMGQTMNMNMDQTSTYNIAVEAIPDNQYKLTNTITSMQLTVKQMGREFSLDSDNPKDLDTPQGAVLKDIINVEIPVTVDHNGKIVSVNTEAIQNENLSKISGNFQTSGFGTTLAFLALPKDLKVGQTWETSTTVNGTSLHSTYKVEAVQKDKVTLNVSGDMNVEQTFEQGQMKTESKIAGSFSGELVVNRTNNLIISSKRLVNLKGKTTVMEKSIPISSTITASTTAKEI